MGIIKKVWVLLLLVVAATSVVMAHDSSRHKKKAEVLQKAAIDSVHQLHNTPAAALANTAPLKEFPTLHPLVVHIPIVFLCIAAVMQVVSLFLFRRELAWTAWVILLIGFVGAYASSTWFHAHTTQLSAEAQQLLEEHEAYADYTIWLSGIAALIQFINLFFLKRKLMVSVASALLVVAAAVVVAIAGHHGAELVHKHGIGAKGFMLEQHH